MGIYYEYAQHLHRCIGQKLLPISYHRRILSAETTRPRVLGTLQRALQIRAVRPSGFSLDLTFSLAVALIDFLQDRGAGCGHLGRDTTGIGETETKQQLLIFFIELENL